MSGRRLTGWLAAGVVSLAIAGQAADAAGTDYSGGKTWIGYDCDIDSGCATLYFAGSRHADHATVSSNPDGTVWTLSDPGGVQAGAGCESISATKIRCFRYPRYIVALGGNNRDDRIRINSDQRIHLLAGASGDDRLVGGSGADKGLYGETDNDSLRGRGGRDIFEGGHGQDEIHAVDGLRDHSIDCGEGEDTAFVDPEDPPAERCETVVTRPSAMAQPTARQVHVARPDDRALDLVDVRPTLRVRVRGSARCTQSVPVVVRERGDRSHVLFRAQTDARGGLVKHLARIPNQTILAEARAFRPEEGGFCPHVQDARSPNA